MSNNFFNKYAKKLGVRKLKMIKLVNDGYLMRANTT